MLEREETTQENVIVQRRKTLNKIYNHSSSQRSIAK